MPVENRVVSQEAITRRENWVNEIVRLSGHFGSDFSRVSGELKGQIEADGTQAIVDHLRFCGAIPESYGHDTSEEKLYSKYTDVLISEVFSRIGFQSLVLTERADAADVEVVGASYGFVADAKAFRLSRTAKNQKDFKIQAMDGWKRGKPFAIVVCPLYQLPAKKSQIYEQAAARNVCIISYSHLAVITRYADISSQEDACNILHEVLRTVEGLTPSKDASQYWLSVNRAMIEFSNEIPDLWNIEKRATLEAIDISKQHSLRYLADERQRMMSLSREEAIRQLIEIHNIANRVEVVNGVTDNDLMGLTSFSA